jgi:tetratricopeptide (TPR) repeat protein
VAREAEREALWALLGRVHRTGSRAAALVTGPTGAGRSHLLAWLVERATELGAARALVVHPGDDAAALLRRWTRTAGVPDDALPDALADALPPELAEVARAVCTPGPALGPRERLVAAGRVIAASSDRPVVITVDDAHASLDAAQLLRDLGEVVGPVLVVGSADDTLLADTPAERAVLLGLPATRVALTRWDRAASAALLRALLPLEGPLEGQLIEAGEGNPGWFVDVVTALVRGDALVPGAAAFRLREGADLGSFRRDPRWEGRLDGVLVTLVPAAQQSLEVLAALGPAVDRERWRDTCEALGLPDPGPRALAPLREQHLVTDAPGEPIRLLHPGLADALRARAVAAGRWVAAHEAAAHTAPDLVDRAIHLVAAGGGRADEVLEALWAGFVACWSTGSRSRAAAIAAAFGERVARGDTGPRWVAMLEVMRAIHALGGHRPLEAGALVEGAVAAAEAAGDLRARAWALRCRLRFWRVASRPDEGRAAAEATLAACRELGDAQLEGEVLIELGNLLATARQLDAAVEVLERARSHPAVQADADAWARAHLSLGAALLNARRHDEALRAYDTALAAFERTGSVWGRAQTLSDRANVWAATGAEPARVRAAHEQAVALFDTIGHPSVAFPSVNLGFLELEAGRPAQARPLLDRAAAVFEGRPAEAPVRAARLRCLAHDGEWAAITQELDAIEEVLARAAVASYGVGVFVEEAARAAAAAGQRELAARLRALPPRFRA